jgi:hypothetical protein
MTKIGRAQDLVYDGWETLAQDTREAKKCFERAIKLDPDLADAYNGRKISLHDLRESLSHPSHPGRETRGFADLVLE